MTPKIGVAEVKKQFSTLIREVSLKGEHFIIERKGRPMAAVVSVKDLDRIEEAKKQRNKETKKQRKKGILAAIGAWEEFDDLEKMVVEIYKGRGKAKERGIGRFN